MRAKSFPEGIQDAHKNLRALIRKKPERRFFGLSRPEDGNGIIYRAGAEELVNGELSLFGLESLTILKGTYIYIDVPDYTADPQAIRKAFDRLTSRPDIDPEGYCVEWYLNEKDVKCMVRLNDRQE
jgi:hypothetical protein